MVRTPQNLEDAKALFREEKAKLTGSLSAIAGSRWLTAILATFVIAFGVNALYGPTQLPSVGGLSLTTVGLPPNLDFGVVGEQAGQALDAAQRQGVGGEVNTFLSSNAQLIPILNWVGLGLTFALLMANMWIMTARRRVSRG
jgi:hypothetical protein